MKAGEPQAAARSSLSAARFTIFSVPSGTGCCSALASSNGARGSKRPAHLGGQDHRHCRVLLPLDVTHHAGMMWPEVPGREISRFERQAGVRQQHVNSECCFVPVSFVLRFAPSPVFSL